MQEILDRQLAQADELHLEVACAAEREVSRGYLGERDLMAHGWADDERDRQLVRGVGARAPRRSGGPRVRQARASSSGPELRRERSRVAAMLSDV